jgi:hypothetical protein
MSGIQMELEVRILNKISQTEKDKYCMFSLICGIQAKTNKQKSYQACRMESV